MLAPYTSRFNPAIGIVATCSAGATKHPQVERAELDEQKARRILSEELLKLRWDAKVLEERRKGAVEKVRTGRRLRMETTMTLRWIATELRMGTWTNATNLPGKCQK